MKLHELLSVQPSRFFRHFCCVLFPHLYGIRAVFQIYAVKYGVPQLFSCRFVRIVREHLLRPLGRSRRHYEPLVLAVDFVPILFQHRCTHTADCGQQIGRDAVHCVGIGGLDKNANRQVHAHLLKPFFLPMRHFSEYLWRGITVMKLCDLIRAPDDFHILGAGFVALFRNGFYKGKLICFRLESDSLPLLYVGTDFYDKLCIFL